MVWRIKYEWIQACGELLTGQATRRCELDILVHVELARQVIIKKFVAA